jgi:hypothetical protein
LIKKLLPTTYIMRNSLQILIICLLIYSCGTLPKLIDGNSFAVERIGIMDTITVNVSGKITDLYNKFGLKGAQIELTNNENSYSKTCGENGVFNFEHISFGKYRVIGNFVGYYQFRDSIELKSGEIIGLKIGLGYDE